MSGTTRPHQGAGERAPLLDVHDLRTSFFTDAGEVTAVDGVGFYVDQGEAVAIVGESGCGKSATALSIMGLIAPPGRVMGGSVRLAGQELVGLPEARYRRIRGKEAAMIFQDPMTSLNPVLSIGVQLMEPLRLHLRLGAAAARRRAIELLDMVGIPAAAQRLDQYPHQFSGGMRQRVMIAMALACEPRLLIADEPTTALDVTIQAQIIDLLRELRDRLHTAILLITHDLGAVAGLCSRVFVMYAGKIVEEGPVQAMYHDPQHPYTWGLLRSIPRLDHSSGERLPAVPGQPPDLLAPPAGCRFHPRCAHALRVCLQQEPVTAPVGGGRQRVACWLQELGPEGVAAARAGSLPTPGDRLSVHPIGKEPAAPSDRPERAAAEVEAPLLKVQDLKMHFPVGAGWLRRRVVLVKAVDGVSFAVKQGETLGLVGESGCGKTTVGRCIVRLYRPTAGTVAVGGQDIASLPARGLRLYRRRIQMIFQDPYASLNPRMTVADIIAEPLDVHGLASGKERLARVQALLATVGLSPEHANRYPHEFSGGQRQRIGVARALAVSPDLIVCDEPISSLDVSIQAQIVNMFRDLQEQYGLAYLFIAHDLAMVKHISDRVAVMYLGHLVEIAPSADLYAAPAHPYTQALLSAAPIPDPEIEAGRRRIILTGEVPSPIDPPSGCPFRTRCRLADERCALERPALRPLAAGRLVACHKAEEALKREWSA